MTVFRSGVVATFCLALSACSEQWSGFVYPDKNNLGTHQFAGHFPSLEECRRGAMDVISALGNAGRNADYECGLDCKGGTGMLVCERTER